MRLQTVVTLFFVASTLHAEPPKMTVKVEKQDFPKGTSKELQPALNAETIVVSDADGLRMRFWMCKELTSRASAEQVKNGLTYREIPEGSFVGVVQIEKLFIDFRKQEIPAGVYSMRLAVQPDVGDHKDTAPHQDFLLLLPIASDKTPEILESKQLLPNSRKTTGSDHPAVVLLFPHFGKDADVKIVNKPNDVVCVQTKVKVTAGETATQLGLAIVVSGFSDKR